MGIRHSVIRRKRRLHGHSTPLRKRRQKVRWLLAQRVRVRNYRRSFAALSTYESAEPGTDAGASERPAADNQPDQQ